MTSEDMIDGISKGYGTATRSVVRVQYRSEYGDAADVLARWEDATNAFDLVRSGHDPTLVLIQYGRRADEVAKIAIAVALRLDAQEAPQREQEQQRLQEQQERLATERARAVNKRRVSSMGAVYALIRVSHDRCEVGSSK